MIFFAPDDPSLDGVELLRQFLQSRPTALEEALLRIVPDNSSLRKALNLENWGWVGKLIGAEESVLDKAAQMIRGRIAGI